MSGGLAESAEVGLALLRRLSSTVADAFTADEVARAALSTVAQIPGVTRAGLALNSAGGRQLRFVSTDEDALTPSRVRWCLIDAFADVPLVDAVRQGRDLYFETIGELEESYAGVAGRQRQLGTHSMVALSLSTDKDSVGGLLLSYDRQQLFDAEQRWLLSALAAQVTQALRSGLAHQVQHSTGEQLQRSLMPRSLPDLPGLALGSHYRPGGLNADVGGDWYDVIVLPDGSTALVLGDVTGKGVAAAVVMSEMRAALRAYAVLDPSPAAVLSCMDALVAAQPGDDQLLTLAYGLVSPDRSSLRVALAGQPPPLVVTPDEPVEVLADAHGPALGMAAGPWTETTVSLSPGRVVLFYSDGLVESRSRDLDDGIRQLSTYVEEITARRRQPRELCARLAQLMTDDHSDDDVTLLAVATAPAGAVRRASLRLPGEATAPREARRFLRSTLTQWAVEEDTVDSAELCVSELVTNAVIHTGSAAELSVLLDEDYLTVLVRDGGAVGSVHLSEPEDPMSVSGRGLGLVDAIATAWAAEHGADGTTVWFEIERAPR